MSMWTYINGTITVSPMGRIQAENRLQCCIDHNKYSSTCDTCEF